jgi:hypothetical protein
LRYEKRQINVLMPSFLGERVRLVHSLGIDNVLSGVRAVLAKDLARQGYSQKEISEILGTSPAAVTLYSKDRRGRQLSKIIEQNSSARLVIDNVMEQINQRRTGAKAEGKDTQSDSFPLILDAAYRIMRLVSSPQVIAVQQTKSPGKQADSLTETLHARLQEEQLAAQRNMALAVGTTDEVARTIFRQIASDSIRHAEIVSFILSLPKGETKGRGAQASVQEDTAQIEAIIKDEESATEQPIQNRGLDPALKLLLKSIDIDEEKHKILLKGLLSLRKAKGGAPC